MCYQFSLFLSIPFFCISVFCYFLKPSISLRLLFLVFKYGGTGICGDCGAGEGRKMLLDALELQLEKTVNCLVGVLGATPSSSWAANAPNH